MPYTDFFHLFTAFGALSLILPFIAAVAGTLWLGGAKQEASVWALATGAALLVVLVLKFIFLPCGHLIPDWQMRSPSGHAASAFAAYGSFAVLESKFRQTNWQRIAILTLGFSFAAGLAVTRWIIHAHTVPEILLGSLAGLIAPIIIFWRIKEATRHAVASPLLLALALPVVLLILLNDTNLPIEGHIERIALAMAQEFGICL